MLNHYSMTAGDEASVLCMPRQGRRPGTRAVRGVGDSVADLLSLCRAWARSLQACSMRSPRMASSELTACSGPAPSRNCQECCHVLYILV